jgi:hypothetical protein
VPPVTTLDAQQLALPLGPQVEARPIHDSDAAQTFAVVSQTGVAPLQLAFERHPTHCDVAPKSLHFGVPPLHAAHVASQLESALQTEHTPAPPQVLLLPQPMSVGA